MYFLHHFTNMYGCYANVEKILYALAYICKYSHICTYIRNQYLRFSVILIIGFVGINQYAVFNLSIDY